MNDSLYGLKKIDVDQFRSDLISWYQAEKRDLPWRKDQDPYKIWVSEVMLQQTRVETVIPYFERFMEKYPTMESFAQADEESILKIWEGLGYYSRVRNLHSAVKEVVEKYDGKVPNTREELSKLKGVGPYTAGAILSIAYGKPEHAVDGNVMRVLSRILLIEEDIAKTATRKIFEQAVTELIDPNDPSSFNQGLMELGALICTPTSPSCLLCPVREHCLAFHEGKEEELPKKTRKKSTKQQNWLIAVLKTMDNRFLIRKRPSEGLLANLWEFPSIEMSSTFPSKRQYLLQFLQTEFTNDIYIDTRTFFRGTHVFSHLQWNMDAFLGKINSQIHVHEPYRLVTMEELDELAFPVPHQKIWKAYKEKKMDVSIGKVDHN